MQVLSALQQIAVWVRGRIGRSQAGSSMVEYALLVTLIAVVCLLAMNQLGQNANNGYSEIATSVAIG